MENLLLKLKILKSIFYALLFIGSVLWLFFWTLLLYTKSMEFEYHQIGVSMFAMLIIIEDKIKENKK